MIGVRCKHDLKGNLSNPTEHHNPEVNKPAPEIFVKCCRIFDPEDEEVSCHHDAVKENHSLSCQCQFEEVIETADDMRQRTKDVPTVFEGLKDMKATTSRRINFPIQTR